MLESLCRQSEKRLLKKLPGILRQAGYPAVNGTQSYIYAAGQLPVMLVAHLDTVHERLPQHIFHDQKLNVYWSPEGLGADDRAGVFAILQLLDYKPYVLFSTGEEVGGQGAKAAAKELNTPPVHMLVELDRRGKDDAVFYQCGNPEFISYIESFGFSENYGSFSDIAVLSPYWEIPGVNLSVGYYDQHTKQEFLRMNELQSTIKRVKSMFQNLPAQRFTYLERWQHSAGLHYEAEYFRCVCCGEFVPWRRESESPFVCEHCDGERKGENTLFEWFD